MKSFFDVVVVSTKYYAEEIVRQISDYVSKEKIIIWENPSGIDGKSWRSRYEKTLRSMM